MVFAVGLTLLPEFGCDGSQVGGTTVGATSSASTGNGGNGAMAGSGSTTGVGGNGGMTGSGGSGGAGNTCSDQGPGEPNDTEATATQLASLNDCDSQAKSVAGTLDGSADVDWYFWVQSEDDSLCVLDPSRDFSQSSGGNLRMCKFVECQDAGATISVSCPGNTTPAMSTMGRAGCCATVGFEIDLGITGCSGSLDDLVNVYMRIDEAAAAADNCNNYNVNFDL
jgi:hypothetical protein